MIAGFEITVDTVKECLKNGEPLFFINLLHHAHKDMSLMEVRGALRLPDDKVEQHLDEIPHDRTIVVYSTCQGDEPSMRAARLLQQHGWNDIHPLIGGFTAYLEAGLPVEKVGTNIPATKIMML